MLDLEQSFDMGQSWTSRGQVREEFPQSRQLLAIFPLLQITVTSSRSGPNNQEQLPLKKSQKDELQVTFHSSFIPFYSYSIITRSTMTYINVFSVFTDRIRKI